MLQEAMLYLDQGDHKAGKCGVLGGFLRTSKTRGILCNLGKFFCLVNFGDSHSALMTSYIARVWNDP